LKTKKYASLIKTEAAIPPDEQAYPNGLDTRSLLDELEARQVKLETQAKELERLRVELASAQAESNQFYDSTLVGYFTLEMDGVIKRANLTGAGMLGRRREQLPGLAFEEFIFSAQRAEFNDLLKKSRSGMGEMLSGEFYLEKTAGQPVWVQVEAGCSADGRECLITLVEIRARNQVETALGESEERYRTITGLMTDYVYMARGTLDGRTTTEWISGAFEQITGYTVEEIAALPGGFGSLVFPEDASKVLELWPFMEAGEKFEVEYRIKSRSGETRWLQDAMRPVPGNINQLGLRMLGAVKDITQRKQAELALAASEKKLKSLIDSQTHFLVRIDLEGKYSYWNPKFEQEFGWLCAPEGLGTANAMATICAHHHERVIAVVKDCLAQPGKAISVEIDKPARDGGVRTTLWEFICITGEDNQPSEIQCMGIEISDRKKMEEDLRQSNEVAQAILNAATESMFLMDLSGIVIATNTTTAERLGTSISSMVGASIFDFLAPEVSDCRKKRLEKVALEGKPTWFEDFHNGRWMENSIYPIFDENGKVWRVAIYGRDITEEKKVAEELRVSESRAQALLRAVPDLMFRLNREGVYLDYKADVRDLYIQADPTGLRNRDLTPPAFADLVDEKIADALSSGQLQTFEYQLSIPGKEPMEYFEARMTPSGTDEVLAVVRNITGRKQVEEQMRMNMEDMQLLKTLNEAVNRGESLAEIIGIFSHASREVFDCLGVMVFLLSPDQSHLEQQCINLLPEVTVKIEALLGHSIPSHRIPLAQGSFFAQMLESECGMLVTEPCDFRKLILEFIDSVNLPDEQLQEVENMLLQVGQVLDVRSTLSIPLKSNARAVGLMGFASRGMFAQQDLTRLQRISSSLTEIIIRKQVEQSLQLSEEKYRQLAEVLEMRVRQRTAEVQDLYDNAPAGYHSLDADGRIVMINQTELNKLGYAREEMLGHLVDEFITRASKQKFRDHFPIFKSRGWTRDFELEYIRKDGTLLPVLVNASASYDEQGNFMLSRSTVFDNTERKAVAETLQRAYLQLEHALRMKDEFLANMSHELRTPLNGILGLSEILLLGYRGALNADQKKYVQNIDSSGRHLLSLINDLLDLSKIEAGKFELHLEMGSINDVCQSSLNFFKEQALKKNILLEFVPEPAIPSILADQRRLKQILVNLLSNAVKFTPSGGKVILKVCADYEHRRLEFAVSDTGIGIAQADLERLFNPFSQVDSSLARQNEGTGLGLALVKRLAEMHGGSVSVSSQIGEGSSFRVALPWEPDLDVQQFLADALKDMPARMQFPHPVVISGRQAAILLVEDNLINQITISEYLESLGYQVSTAVNGVDAIQKARDSLPALILMDIQMPELDGLEATRRLRADPRCAEIPIVALTALAMPGDRERCLAAGANEYLCKPVGLENLADLIHGLLNTS